MIKPINEIPVNEKKGTYREKVRADIQEAILRNHAAQLAILK